MPFKATYRLLVAALLTISGLNANAGPPGSIHSGSSHGPKWLPVPASQGSSNYWPDILDSATHGEPSPELAIPPPAQGPPSQADTSPSSPPDPNVPSAGPPPVWYTHLVDPDCASSHVFQER